MTTTLALINADWQDFQNMAASDENWDRAILIKEYLQIFDRSGWLEIHIIQAPRSSERFHASVVAAMQKKRILG